MRCGEGGCGDCQETTCLAEGNLGAQVWTSWMTLEETGDNCNNEILSNSKHNTACTTHITQHQHMSELLS